MASEPGQHFPQSRLLVKPETCFNRKSTMKSLCSTGGRRAWRSSAFRCGVTRSVGLPLQHRPAEPGVSIPQIPGLPPHSARKSSTLAVNQGRRTWNGELSDEDVGDQNPDAWSGAPRQRPPLFSRRGCLGVSNSFPCF
ncbi:N-Acetylmuramoyl-L-Alanine Amidase [Manis pentadactyla]|nr:N-Acetylmuramoyl-L-Alanine Amidase [Manis pentadactyla]